MTTHIHRSTWRPVQGPPDARPGVIAGTGHILGVEYASHYWAGTYVPVLAHVDGSVTVEWLTGDDAGQRLTHRTALHPSGRRNLHRDAHPVSERCVFRFECRKRAEDMAAGVSG